METLKVSFQMKSSLHGRQEIDEVYDTTSIDTNDEQCGPATTFISRRLPDGILTIWVPWLLPGLNGASSHSYRRTL
jgi:hypothetical protein